MPATNNDNHNTKKSKTASWVGGGYLNGTAEAVFKHGLLNAQVPIGYAMSLALEARIGFLFAACTGQTAKVIVGLNGTECIIVSSVIAAFCACLGGLCSLVYTDTFQLWTAFVGLWLCVPFCLNSRTASSLKPNLNLQDREMFPPLPETVDRFLSLAYGGIPWQVYFQRVLGSATAFEAQMMSYASAIGCLILAAPPVVIGAISRNTNFTSAGYPGPSDLRPEDQPSVLPFALRYLCPNVISVMGMTAIIGAVLSSADSSALSASTLITRNVYQIIYRPTATDQEMAKVLRCVVCIASAAATSVALFATSVFALWTLSTEMVYVVLFPQLLCVFYLPQRTNSYGCIVGARKATDISRGPEPTSMTPATATEVVRPRPEDLPVASVRNRHESAELDETRPNRASPLLIGRPPSLVGESPQISTTLTGREIFSVLTRTSSEDISDAAAAVQRSADNQVKSDVLSGFSKQDDASRHKKCEVTTTGEQGGESSVTDRNIDGAENAATSSVSLTTLSSAQAEISSTSSATEDRTQDKKRRSKKQARSERPKKPKKRQQH
ncbi:hypothetical protein V5799_018291 [Amblyomma americanum]|uniref:Uncharacterized protein n=1 Tax=Amblyomma americanum TaxID=6943 RepID=A0AAQ4F0W1_AMBAM